MGLQDEYLRNFVILLTEKGVVPLTDPLQISVYNSLCSGTKRPNDLSSELEIPSSSLHFVLDKMVDSGIIVRAKPDPDKKSVYYSNLALKIAGSFTPDDSAKGEAEDTFNDPARYYNGMSSVANMLDAYTSEIGLDLDTMRANYATKLADACRDRIGKCGMEDAILRIRDVFAELTGFKFNVYALNPLTLVYEGDRSMRSKVDMLTHFVARAIENAADRTYVVVTREDFSNDETARVKVTFDRVERVPEPYMNMSLPQTSEVDRFMMVDLDGSAGLMTSDVQIDIVDAVYERPLCITDIVNKVNAPRSTITSNLLRMVEEGVVSVFYSESGSAYYGLSCSILMKKSRNVNRDYSETGSILSDASCKEGSFMEGYLLYTLARLKDLGFDTDYMMVVLGAKYMRSAGRGAEKNFDVFFGKMSDIGNAIGLSLNVVSVYPLTIGITSADPESEMSPAMTFVNGMAHQGLEMASNGIFVRSVEEADTARKISFKEIYPALSMTPVEGIRVEELAAPASSKKKRTSSVKTALLNRSAKEGNKPARTVRYITGITMLVMLSAVLVLAFGGDTGSDADTYSVEVDESCTSFVFYDDVGNEMTLPLSVSVNTVLTFSMDQSDSVNVGTVQDGKAYLLEPNEDGMYTITVQSDLVIETVHEVSLPEDKHYDALFYNFSDKVGEKYASNFTGYIPAGDYIEVTGGMWVGNNAAVRILTEDGYYVSTNGGKSDTVLWDDYISWDPTMSGISIEELPEGFITVSFNGDYRIDGKYVTGDLRMGMWRPAKVTFMGFETSGTTIVMTDESGYTTTPSVNVNGMFYLQGGNKDLQINYKLGNLI